VLRFQVGCRRSNGFGTDAATTRHDDRLRFTFIGYRRSLIGSVQCIAHFGGGRISLLAILRHRFGQHLTDFRSYQLICFMRRQQRISLAIYERGGAR
jgi:hypothetical protein